MTWPLLQEVEKVCRKCGTVWRGPSFRCRNLAAVTEPIITICTPCSKADEAELARFSSVRQGAPAQPMTLTTPRRTGE